MAARGRGQTGRDGRQDRPFEADKPRDRPSGARLGRRRQLALRRRRRLIEELAPDLIVTQDLSRSAQSRAASWRRPPGRSRRVSLDPRTLADVAESVHTLAVSARPVGRGEKIVSPMWETIDRRADRAGAATPARVLRRVDRTAVLRRALAPEMIELAGGTDILGSRRALLRDDVGEVVAHEPELVVVGTVRIRCRSGGRARRRPRAPVPRRRRGCRQLLLPACASPRRRRPSTRPPLSPGHSADPGPAITLEVVHSGARTPGDQKSPSAKL